MDRIETCIELKKCHRKNMVKELCDRIATPATLYNLSQLCNLIVGIKINWKKRRYPIILDEFKDIVSDSIFVR